MKLKVKPPGWLLLALLLMLGSCRPLSLNAQASPSGFEHGNAPSPEPTFGQTRAPSQTVRATSTHSTPSATISDTLSAPTRMSLTPTHTSTPLACLKSGGKIRRAVLQTDLLRQPLEYRVYSPACYEQLEHKRYAVLFLLHGAGFGDDQWERLGVNERMDSLVAAGEIPPFIIVMPYDRFSGEPTENNFGRVLVEELLPLIDATYRTLPQRQYRAIGGISRGAAWAVHLALHHWELFATLGAHSPTVFYTDAQQMPRLLEAIPPSSYPRIFIDVGDRDFPPSMEVASWFEDMLNAFRVPHEWHLFSGFHEEAYWKAHLDFYLRWYAQLW